MSAIEDHPRELSLEERRGKWRLSIHSAHVSGWAESPSRACVEAVAEAYAAYAAALPEADRG